MKLKTLIATVLMVGGVEMRWPNACDIAGDLINRCGDDPDADVLNPNVGAIAQFLNALEKGKP